MNPRKTKTQERTGKYKELKEKIKDLLLCNPTIQVRDIIEKTGASEYIVLRAYLPLRRALFARSSR